MINPVSVKNLIEFRRLTERRQLNFANKLKIPKEPEPDDSGGGNYWIRSHSAICNAFKYNNNAFIKEKIDEVAPLYEASDKDNTRTMYKRNLDVLYNYESFDFSNLYPSRNLNFLKKSQLPLEVKGITIKVTPDHVFSYGSKEAPNIGCIWFVIWWEGFRMDDLKIFSEASYRYLSTVYADKFKIDADCCCVVDILTMRTIAYSQVLKEKMPSLLHNTIDTLKKYL